MYIFDIKIPQYILLQVSQNLIFSYMYIIIIIVSLSLSVIIYLFEVINMVNDHSAFMQEQFSKDSTIPVRFQINELAPTKNFPPHFHNAIEMLYVYQGQIAVTVQGVEYIVSKNELCFIPSNAIHSIRNLNAISKYDCCFLNTNYYINDNIDINKYQISIIISNNIVIDDYKKLKKVFNSDKQNFKATALKSLGTFFVIELITHCLENQKYSLSQRDPKVKIVREITLYLNTHSCENINIDTIYKQYNYSHSYLSRLFKKYTNTTMSKMLNHYRCLNAQNLLMTEDLSILEISEKCGFNNFSYFTKTYKNIIGELPSDTKNKNIH